MKKGGRKSPDYQYKWMSDKDLRTTIMLLMLVVLMFSFIILWILARIDPEGYILLLTPINYIFTLYQKAGAGAQLSFIQIPFFTVIGFFLGLFLKKK
jgi:hypothetical protein